MTIKKILKLLKKRKAADSAEDAVNPVVGEILTIVENMGISFFLRNLKNSLQSQAFPQTDGSPGIVKECLNTARCLVDPAVLKKIIRFQNKGNGFFLPFHHS